MAETTEDHAVVFEHNGVALTKPDAAAVLGGLLAIASLPLPWVSGFTRSLSGFEYTWLWPVFVAAAVLAIGLAVPAPYPRVRYGAISLAGVCLASMGIVFLLGLPSLGAGVGIGVVLFALGGLLVTGGGYTALIRRTSTLQATAVLCIGSIALLVVGIVAIQAT